MLLNIRVHVSVPVLLFICIWPKSGSMNHVTPLFVHLLRNVHTALHRGCTNFSSPKKQAQRVPFPPYSFLHSLIVDFWWQLFFWVGDDTSLYFSFSSLKLSHVELSFHEFKNKWKNHPQCTLNVCWDWLLQGPLWFSNSSISSLGHSLRASAFFKPFKVCSICGAQNTRFQVVVTGNVHQVAIFLNAPFGLLGHRDPKRERFCSWVIDRNGMCQKKQSRALSHYFIPPYVSTPRQIPSPAYTTMLRVLSYVRERSGKRLPWIPHQQETGEQGLFKGFPAEVHVSAVHRAWLGCRRARVALEMWILHREFCSGVYLLAPPPQLPPLHPVQPWHQAVQAPEMCHQARCPRPEIMLAFVF